MLITSIPEASMNDEMEALQQRLAHARRIINTLKGSLRREKELRMDYHKKLESSHGFNEGDLAESPKHQNMLYEDYEDMDSDEQPKRKATPYRVGRGRGRGLGGRGGRGRGGLTLAERFGRAAQSPASEYTSSYDRDDHTASPPPPALALPAHFQDKDKEEPTQAPQEVEDGELRKSLSQ
ncbi:hypothetical protein FIBSPDRAFT_952281 [Athelia psychrophila]|uniref:Uncharacterized protein n=1 Tax=Athelia psychrophila TaxID=1759441 RepID=A0A166LQM3_9AGAM|nr:hypothetical protein FIBSPDRAFT_952281 [Fibularhizoctonia sp. CBS 109695]